MNGEICRICRNNNNLKYIEGENLLDKLKICANITINYDDCLPKYICQQCEKALDLSYRLRKQSEETEKRLRAEQLLIGDGEEQQQPEVYEEYLEEFEYELLHVADESNEIIEEIPIANTISTLDQEYPIGQNFDDEKLTVEENDDNMSEVYLEEEEEIVKKDRGFIKLEDKEISTDKNYTSENTGSDCIVLKICHFEVSATEKTHDSDASLKKKTYTCATCLLEFSTQTDYRQHIKQHEHQRFHCIQCTKSFPKHFQLKQHEQCHMVEVELHNCTHCEKKFRYYHSLVRHIRVAHEFQRRYACTLCTLTFGRVDVLKNHLITHVEERNFQCAKCLECFKSQRYLDSHLKKHLPKQKKSPQITTKTNEQLKTSIGLLNEKLYYCPHCGKKSKHRFTHVNHLRTHTQERPYACEICPKKFRTQAAKLTHVRIHSNVRPYQCEHCLTSFRQLSHLKEHRMIHDGIMPHTCSICNMSFTKKSNMSVHMRVHTGERPYKCANCAQEFSKLSILKRHEAKSHSGGVSSVQNIFVEENASIVVEEVEKVERIEEVEVSDAETAEVSITTAVDLISKELSDIYEFNATDDKSIVLVGNGDRIMVMKTL